MEVRYGRAPRPGSRPDRRREHDVVVTPFPNILYAFDLTKPGPAVKWKYEPKPAPFAKGVACCDLVNRGAVFADGRVFITTLDAVSGKVAWTAFNTGPDSDGKIGPAFRPFHPQDRGPDLGVKTWPPGRWKLGGGNVWGWPSYDPELNLVCHGTGNAGVWNPDLRPGDNKNAVCVRKRAGSFATRSKLC